MVNENWRDIKNYEGLYQISNLGNVKSLCNNKTRKEKILKKAKNSVGYLFVNLSKNGKIKQYLIHRLIAEAFIDNPNNLPCIDHINTIRTDNRIENLRWCTYKENSNNPLTVEKRSKSVLQLTLTGEFIKKWNSIIDVQRELGIEHSNISYCCKGKYKTVGGYIWRYAN